MRINGQTKVEVEHLAPLAEIVRLAFVQLHYLPRIETLEWLADKPKHVEIVAMKGIKSIGWPGFEALESFALLPPFGKIAKLDLSRLPSLKKLKRVSLPPLIAKAFGGRKALDAFEKGTRNLYITDFRAEVARELDLDSPYV